MSVLHGVLRRSILTTRESGLSTHSRGREVGQRGNEERELYEKAVKRAAKSNPTYFAIRSNQERPTPTSAPKIFLHIEIRANRRFVKLINQWVVQWVVVHLEIVIEALSAVRGLSLTSYGWTVGI